jgi:hypothetical protein
MRTKQQLKNKKKELEEWLELNPMHHANHSQVDHDLRKVINELATIDSNVKRRDN